MLMRFQNWDGLRTGYFSQALTSTCGFPVAPSNSRGDSIPSQISATVTSVGRQTVSMVSAPCETTPIYTVPRARRITFYLVNRVENQNEPKRRQSGGRLGSFLVFNSAFGIHMHWLISSTIIITWQICTTAQKICKTPFPKIGDFIEYIQRNFS